MSRLVEIDDITSVPVEELVFREKGKVLFVAYDEINEIAVGLAYEGKGLIRFVCRRNGKRFNDTPLITHRPPFAFPEGIGEAVGKAFRHKEGDKVLVYGDIRIADPGYPYPIYCFQASLRDSHSIKWCQENLIDYWDDKEEESKAIDINAHVSTVKDTLDYNDVDGQESLCVRCEHVYESIDGCIICENKEYGENVGHDPTDTIISRCRYFEEKSE